MLSCSEPGPLRRAPAFGGTVLLLCLLCCPASGRAAPEPAADLFSLYQEARREDPNYKQFQVRLAAAREDRPQALAALLPRVELSAHAEARNQDITSNVRFGTGDGERDFNSYGYALSLRQPIYRHELYLLLRRSEHTLAEAEQLLEDAAQQLIVRVAERYFEILAAEDNLRFAAKELQSLRRRLEQAEQRFSVGLSAITDVRETRAAHDRVLAAELQARNQLDRANERLREVIGRRPARLLPRTGEWKPELPRPPDIEYWAALSRRSSPLVLAARQASEAALLDAEIARAGHLPGVDLLSSRSFNSSGGLFGRTETHDVQLGVEFKLPLFQGGAVASQVRRSKQHYRAALEQLDQQQRTSELRTRESYLAVLSGIGVVRALQRSVLSSETALEATRAGFEVGTRTSVDVIGAEQALSEAQRDHARARYDYILNSLRLRQASGVLSEHDLRRISGRQWNEASDRPP